MLTDPEKIETAALTMEAVAVELATRFQKMLASGEVKGDAAKDYFWNVEKALGASRTIRDVGQVLAGR